MSLVVLLHLDAREDQRALLVDVPRVGDVGGRHASCRSRPGGPWRARVKRCTPSSSMTGTRMRVVGRRASCRGTASCAGRRRPRRSSGWNSFMPAPSGRARSARGSAGSRPSPSSSSSAVRMQQEKSLRGVEDHRPRRADQRVGHLADDRRRSGSRARQGRRGRRSCPWHPASQLSSEVAPRRCAMLRDREHRCLDGIGDDLDERGTALRPGSAEGLVELGRRRHTPGRNPEALCH